MKLRSRLESLERAYRPDPLGHIPLFVDIGDPDGITVDGQFMTWAEIEARYPDAPKPMHWRDDDRFPTTERADV